MLLLSFRISKSDKTSKSNKQKIPHKTGIPPPQKKIENVSPVHVNIDPEVDLLFRSLNYVITKAGKQKKMFTPNYYCDITMLLLTSIC